MLVNDDAMTVQRVWLNNLRVYILPLAFLRFRNTPEFYEGVNRALEQT